MNAWDWWAQASRPAKIAATCTAVPAVLGLVVGLSHLERSLPDPAPPLSDQIAYDTGHEVARYHLGRGDSRNLAEEKCKTDVRARQPDTDISVFKKGCIAGVSNWEDSDWPGGAPTQGN